jgi:hypothetical protein
VEHLRLGFTVVGTEAAVAAVLFAVILFGLMKKKSWAPILAIAVTVVQRVFATYVFFPSTGDFSDADLEFDDSFLCRS